MSKSIPSSKFAAITTAFSLKGLLPGERPEAFEPIRKRYAEELVPEGILEETLFEELMHVVMLSERVRNCSAIFLALSGLGREVLANEDVYVTAERKSIETNKALAELAQAAREFVRLSAECREEASKRSFVKMARKIEVDAGEIARHVRMMYEFGCGIGEAAAKTNGILVELQAARHRKVRDFFALKRERQARIKLGEQRHPFEIEQDRERVNALAKAQRTEDKQASEITEDEDWDSFKK